ncbi:D-alanyl-D-alanine carboxypeptidase (penicillin-binding protein 5/6) [Tissierella praeacuta DSM 18095]|uniref:D-alanyl-D-alanine carboxypeptidase (Penicillin-binding protein 5/6) n=1 Tax=Tissierella praeacuta DSM 18095 TaxID=1123404 RepID=A0A1M4UBZ2_9FIRM|nr:D-alanyl-D-alanine carboxypeptidase [Tissierella praeacuta]SHE54322.1 D-alanyl-D-alanine carboxypeptidase (penicillin-binding protein 5/6) [Tissierella praeacuta DSM 18095]SUP04013.1 D-alanyl-D-alanine carboxypeptidase dacB precursor [Tissierella praeacuta]
MKKKRCLKKLVMGILTIVVLFKLTTFLDLSNLIGSETEKISIEASSEYISIEDIVSENAVVIEKDIGKIVMGKNYNERIHPASMTKVMTAVVGIENIRNLNERTNITQDIIDYCITKGLSVSGFEPGDNPKIIDLLYGILLESGGESSIALARYVSGTEEKFISLMNEKANELGMKNTHFSNSTGITDSENYSTAEDIGILFKYALENKKFKKIVESKEYEARGVKGTFTKHTINNHLFLKRSVLDIDKNYIKCGKTGYTEAAGLCLVSSGEVNNREYIVVTAHADGNSQTEQYNLTDTEKIYNKLKISD